MRIERVAAEIFCLRNDNAVAAAAGIFTMNCALVTGRGVAGESGKGERLGVELPLPQPDSAAAANIARYRFFIILLPLQ